MSRSMLIALTVAIAACNISRPNPTSPSSGGDQSGALSTAVNSGRPQVVIERFIDYGLPAHANLGPAPTGETASYSLMQGGIHWHASNDHVQYWIRGTEDVTNGNAAIEASVTALDHFITTRQFERVVSQPPATICGINEIVWESIDGLGNVLASTGVCSNPATKEILGFSISIDTDDVWSTGASDPNAFDVQNAITHEMGHVAGLGHDNAPKDGCLTMYKFALMGELQKQTLGLGDKLGLDALYNTGEIGAGPGCGN